MGSALQLVLLAALSRPTAAVWARGSIEVPAGGAVFLAKFCFDYKSDSAPGNYVGRIEATLHSPNPGRGDMQFVLFDDEAVSYPDGTRFGGFSCGSHRLTSMARWTYDINATKLKSGVTPTSDIFEKIRPRWWYAAIVDCAGVDRTIDYSVHMLNPTLGWLKELSMDRCGPSWMYFFLALYVVLSCAQGFALVKRSTTARTQHPLRIMLTSCVLTGTAGMLFLLLNTLWLARHGEDQSNLYLVAKILKAWSKYTLLCMLILLSKGRCISAALNLRDVWSASRILVPVCIASLALEVWGEYSQSRKYTTDFVYCTRLGAVIIFSDLCLLGLYLRNIWRSWVAETDPVKQQFYRTWGFAYSLAFLVLPVSSVVAQLVAPWVRVEVVFLLSNFAYSMLLALLVVGLWPEWSQPFFCIDQTCAPAQTFGIKLELLDEAGTEEPWMRLRSPSGSRTVSLKSDLELVAAS